MRIALIILLFFSAPAEVSAQKWHDASPLECGPSWPPDVMADTITRLIFIDKSYPASDFSGIKPLSNYSFTSRSCELIWFPVYSYNITDFIHQALNHRHSMIAGKSAVIRDTLTCRLFEKDMEAIYYKYKGKRSIILYEKKSGHQMVFFATIKGLTKPQTVIAFLEQLFKKY